MTKRKYQVRFLTPGFLGNARQDGQWRTPPFKALLRQWWRVAWVEQNDFSNDVRALHDAEDKLFGSAAGESGCRSRVRLRLGHWDLGKLKSWDGLEQRTVRHPEVQRTGYKVGPHAYLGFGPLDGRGGTKLGKPNAAIQGGESADLRLAFPSPNGDAGAALLDRALALMHGFGTLGGRSRNGWGSFALLTTDGSALTLHQLPQRDWQACLDRDWPHAIGSDGQGALIWQTGASDDWKSLMRQLAEIKIGLRTQKAFEFHSGNNTSHPEARHWLSHPVTEHNVRPWKQGRKQGRLPNSLRFKVRADDDGRLRGVIFHVPCLPPPQLFHPDADAIKQVWQQVHAFLDGRDDLHRSPA